MCAIKQNMSTSLSSSFVHFIIFGLKFIMSKYCCIAVKCYRGKQTNSDKKFRKINVAQAINWEKKIHSPKIYEKIQHNWTSHVWRISCADVYSLTSHKNITAFHFCKRILWIWTEITPTRNNAFFMHHKRAENILTSAECSNPIKVDTSINNIIVSDAKLLRYWAMKMMKWHDVPDIDSSLLLG